MSRQFYYKEDISAIRRGPVSADWLWDSVSSGQLDPEVRVCEVGTNYWTTFSSLPDCVFSVRVLHAAANVPTHRPPGRRSGSWLASALLAPLILALGRYHIVTGKQVGFKLVPKASFGFTDTFINVDEITGMPWISATSQHPLGVQALEREHMILSPKEQEQRRMLQIELDQQRRR